MTLKGEYDASTSYSVGDVVKFEDAGYVLKESAPAGTPPTWDRAWRRLGQDLWDVVDMILDVAALNVSEDGIVLKSGDNEYLISVDATGDTPELAVELIEEGD